MYIWSSWQKLFPPGIIKVFIYLSIMWQLRVDPWRPSYLVFAAGALLLLLDEVGGGGGRGGRPHAPDDPDTVLGEGGQPQLLPLPHLDVLQLLEAAQGELHSRGTEGRSTSQRWIQDSRWSICPINNNYSSSRWRWRLLQQCNIKIKKYKWNTNWTWND